MTHFCLTQLDLLFAQCMPRDVRPKVSGAGEQRITLRAGILQQQQQKQRQRSSSRVFISSGLVGQQEERLGWDWAWAWTWRGGRVGLARVTLLAAQAQTHAEQAAGGERGGERERKDKQQQAQAQLAENPNPNPKNQKAMSIAVTNKPTGQAVAPLHTQLSFLLPPSPSPCLRHWHLQLINLRFSLCKLQAAGAFWH